MGKECKQALNESLFATSCSEMGKYENNSSVDGSGVYGGDGYLAVLFKIAMR